MSTVPQDENSPQEKSTPRNEPWYVASLIAGLDAPPNVKLLLFLVQHHTNARKHVAWPSQRRLAREMNVSMPTVERTFAQAKRMGFLGSRRIRVGKLPAQQYSECWLEIAAMQRGQHPSLVMADTQMNSHQVRSEQPSNATGTPITGDGEVLEVKQYSSKAVIKTPCAADAAQEVLTTCPLPDWMPILQWTEFLKARGKKTTVYEQEVLIKQIDKLRRSGHDPASVLEQSIANRWKGAFPLPAERLDPDTRDYRNMLAVGLIPKPKK